MFCVQGSDILVGVGLSVLWKLFWALVCFYLVDSLHVLSDYLPASESMHYQEPCEKEDVDTRTRPVEGNAEKAIAERMSEILIFESETELEMPFCTIQKTAC